MKVQIQLYGTLRSYLPADADSHSIAPGTTVWALLKDMKIPTAKVHLTFLNGVRAEHDSMVRDGDVLGVFPSLGGG